MVKFLVIFPSENTGRLIQKGLSVALRTCGFLTVERNVEEMAIEELETLNITTILSLNVDCFQNPNLLKYFKQNKKKYNFINYFVNNPKDLLVKVVDEDCLQILEELKAHIFVNDTNYIDMFKKATYLPLGVNPDLYEPDFLQPNKQICYIGNLQTSKEQKIIATVVRIYGKKLVIYSEKNFFEKNTQNMYQSGLISQAEYETLIDCYVGNATSEKERAKVYNRSLINLNITTDGQNNLNYKVFEITGSCAFLLTDWQKDISQFFSVGKDLETYLDDTDLVDKIDFYFKNTEISQRIALLGYEKTLSKHTFIDRARTILYIAEKK